MRRRLATGATAAAALMTVVLAAAPARAHFSGFKSPGPGMHFTQGQPLVIFADLFDSRDGKGFIVCPTGQTVSNTTPPPDYSDPPRPATCSGGGTPTGWPAFQILIDGVVQTDIDAKLDTIPNTVAFDHNINPDPIGFFRFRADTTALGPGPHQIVARGMFSNDAKTITNQDSAPLSIFIDAPPAKTIMNLTANVTGTVNWSNVIVVGNGHSVTASGSLVVRNSLVTGLSAFGGNVSDATIEGNTFEDTGAITLTLGNGAVSIKNNELRANNRLTFVASDPSVPFIIKLTGSGTNQKLFQGNHVGAGQMSFGGQGWLIGGDTDDQSNIFIGPRTVLNIGSKSTIVRGNYSHHNYRGAWSQGFNFYYMGAGSDVLTEHNFIRDSSWPLQYLAGEFRYNVVYGYGHTWLRTASPNTILHHNVFTPGGDGGLDSGLECYGGENGLRIYNNTFDGGGAAMGDFSNATVAMTGNSQVASFRNNLVTFSRNVSNDSPGAARITGGSASYQYADYNAFYSPDNTNKTNYDFSGAGAHDVADGSGGQLAANPFAGARIPTDSSRMIDPVIDEAAIWQGTQKLSQVLALFRARYSPKAGSPIIDKGDPQDNDSQGRVTDIGAIDVGGHDQDKLGKFGTPPLELVPPTVMLTAPGAGDQLSGTVTLSAIAMDNAGGTGVTLVQFLIDGGTVAQSATSPYSVSYNSATVANGDHTFAAKAWDAAGNSAVSAPITAHTMNAVLVQPDGGAGLGLGGNTGSGNGGGNNGGGNSGGDNGGGGIGGPKLRAGAVTSSCGCAVPAGGASGVALTIAFGLLSVSALRLRRRR